MTFGIAFELRTGFEQFMSLRIYGVVTTVQAPTECMVRLAKAWPGAKDSLLVAGDRKGPFTYPLEGARLLTIDDQNRLPYHLARILPEKHYARKNLAYLMAMEEGAGLIYETDDDNAPLPDWGIRQLKCASHQWNHPGWVNVYRWFSDKLIWPRGLALDAIRNTELSSVSMDVSFADCPVQQGLANGSPDVDAIWRLVCDEMVDFEDAPSVRLSKGTWCPFNSQSTWWWPEAFPLMYLPSLVPFRMTDIWRSFVAQRCLWAMDRELVFHRAEVVQNRNPHTPFHDFVDEVNGYLRNPEIRTTLESLDLEAGISAIGQNLHRCYESLVRIGVVPQGEMPLLEAWIQDCGEVEARPRSVGD